MKTKVALCQMYVEPGDPRKNLRSLAHMAKSAKEMQADVAIFPEMCIPGYLIGDAWERIAFLRECEDCNEHVRLLSGEIGIAIVFGSVIVAWDKVGEDGRPRKHNSCLVCESGAWVPSAGGRHYAIKTLQPNYREFDDDRHFYSWRKMSSLPQQSVFTLASGAKIGCMLCEDGWDDDYETKSPAFQMGAADFIVNVSCSPFTSGKNDKRNRVFSSLAKQVGKPLVYVNCVGVQDNGKTVYTIDGESCAYDASGRSFHTAMPFAASTAVADIEGGSVLGLAPFNPGNDDIGKVCRSILYGTRTMMERLGILRVVIGASGGIDSCLAAALYSRIIPPEDLYLVNMPTRHNTATTIGIAQKLAENLGCRYASVPIGSHVEATFEALSSCGKIDVDTSRESLLKGNIAARDRSSGVLASFAAAFGGVFTCNANKSEMTVGYTTLYGDLGGWLANLGDLWKGQVYEMARHFNDCVADVIPKEALVVKPSAELEDSQNPEKGGGDPFDYPYHDKLFASWVEKWDRATPEDNLQWFLDKTLEKNMGLDPDTADRVYSRGAWWFAQDADRWWKLYTGLAVAKRIQAPPVLAVSRRAFGFDHREAQMATVLSHKFLSERSKFSV